MSAEDDIEDDPLALPTLTPADIVAIEKRIFANALAKLESGQSLSKKEWDSLENAGLRSAKSTPAAPIAATPLQETSPDAKNSVFALHAGVEKTHAEIAAAYGLAEGKNGVRTVHRLNAIGRLPEVNQPPPWHDPPALAEWYRLHYRSDPTKPARSKPKETLPSWLANALAAHRACLPSEAPPPAPGAPAFSAGPAAAAEPLPDALATARAMLAAAHRYYLRVESDPSAAPAARRAYLEILEKVQQAEKRARDSGETESMLRVMVDDRIDRVHRNLPSHLTREMIAMREEIHEASAAPDTFPAWCIRFFAAVGERLSRTQFQPMPAPEPTTLSLPSAA